MNHRAITLCIKFLILKKKVQIFFLCHVSVLLDLSLAIVNILSNSPSAPNFWRIFPANWSSAFYQLSSMRDSAGNKKEKKSSKHSYIIIIQAKQRLNRLRKIRKSLLRKWEVMCDFFFSLLFLDGYQHLHFTVVLRLL